MGNKILKNTENDIYTADTNKSLLISLSMQNYEFIKDKKHLFIFAWDKEPEFHSYAIIHLIEKKNIEYLNLICSPEYQESSKISDIFLVLAKNSKYFNQKTKIYTNHALKKSIVCSAIDLEKLIKTHINNQQFNEIFQLIE